MEQTIIIKQNLYNKRGVLLLSKGEKISLTFEKKQLLVRLGIYDEIFNSEIKQNITNNTTPISVEDSDKSKNFEIEKISIKLSERFNKISKDSAYYSTDIIQTIIYNYKGKDWYNYFILLFAYDAWLYAHSINTALISCLIGINLGWDNSKLEVLALGAIFHDIGITLLPRGSFNKKSTLTEIELKILKNHSDMGYALLQETTLPQMSKNIIIQHHENLNGTGYPNKLRKEDIDIESQIVMIAEFFDTATTGRYQNQNKTPEEVFLEMELEPEIYPHNIVQILKSLF